jgi:hypothetical protein
VQNFWNDPRILCWRAVCWFYCLSVLHAAFIPITGSAKARSLAQSAARSFWNAFAPRTSPRAHLRWRLSQFFCTMNKLNTADLRGVLHSVGINRCYECRRMGSVVASRVEQTLLDVKTETPDAQEMAVAGPSSADPAVMDVYPQRGVTRPTNWTGKTDRPLQRCNDAINRTICLRCISGWRPRSPPRFAWQP